MSEVKNACEAAINASFDEATLDGFCRTGAGYLVFILERFNAQDQKHSDLLRPRLTAEEGNYVPVLDDLDVALASSREAIERLRVALEGRRSGKLSAAEFVYEVRAYVDYYNRTLRKRQHVISPLFERHYTIADWRAASFVTADSILEERTRYAAVQAELPSGLELKSAGRPG
jgi:hypothetical protein